MKATKEKRWGKVKALQRLLTHSFSGKALAVRRVTENQGKNTPGVDKVTWNTPRKKITAISSLRQRDYHPQPLRRIYIPKKNGKKRPLGIPVIRMQSDAGALPGFLLIPWRKPRQIPIRTAFDRNDRPPMR